MSRDVNLDSIIYDYSGVTPEQLAEARHAVERLGGDLLEHLRRLGYLSNREAVKILAVCHKAGAIDPATAEIEDDAIDLLPASFARKWQVLPVVYDPETGHAEFATPDPADAALGAALQKFLPHLTIELLAAPKTRLKLVIDRLYPPQPESRAEPQPQTAKSTAILMLTPFPAADQRLADGFSAEGHTVLVSNDPVEAVDFAREHSLEALFIRRDFEGRADNLEQTVREYSPHCRIKWYSSILDLIRSDVDGAAGVRFLDANLKLLTSLIAPEEARTSGRLGRLPMLTARVCAELRLQNRERLPIVNAAHLFDLACATASASDQNWQKNIERVQNMLGAESLPRQTTEILKQVHQPMLNQDAQTRTEVRLGPSILAAVDYFLREQEDSGPLTVERYRQLRQEYQTYSGKHFHPRVVEAVLEVLKHEVEFNIQPTDEGRVLVFTDGGEDKLMLTDCLVNLGFQTRSVDTGKAFIESFRTFQPKITVILVHGSGEDALKRLIDLAAHGFKANQATTFVLARSIEADTMTRLLQQGVEDAASYEGDIDPILVKMHRIKEREKKEETGRIRMLQALGTHGTLDDMSVIDLVQTMGMTKKTVEISVTAGGQQLVIFMSNGQLVYAECEGTYGPDAVYAAIGWTEGIWSIDSVDPDKLPKPNNTQSVDSILIEGCHRLDEETNPGSTDDSTTGDAEPDFSFFDQHTTQS